MIKFKNSSRNTLKAGRDRDGQAQIMVYATPEVKAIAMCSGNQTVAVAFGILLAEAVTGDSQTALNNAATLAGITPRELRRMLRAASRKPAPVEKVVENA